MSLVTITELIAEYGAACLRLRAKQARRHALEAQLREQLAAADNAMIDEGQHVAQLRHQIDAVLAEIEGRTLTEEED